MPSAGRRASVRRTLLVTVLAAVAATWLVTAVVSYFDARHELDELLDAHLAQSASLLLAQVGRESEAIELEHSPDLHRYGRRVVFQFWENGTVLRLHSTNAPNARLSARTDGFSDVDIEGGAWRVFSGWDADRRYLVQIGERRAGRDEIVANLKVLAQADAPNAAFYEQRRSYFAGLAIESSKSETGKPAKTRTSAEVKGLRPPPLSSSPAV